MLAVTPAGATWGSASVGEPTSPASTAATPTAESVDSGAPLAGKFVLWRPGSDGYYGLAPGAEGSLVAATEIGGVTRAEALDSAAEALFPALGATGPIRVGERCLVPGVLIGGSRTVALGDCSAGDVYDVTMDHSGRIELGDRVVSSIKWSGGGYPTHLIFDDGPTWLGYQLDLTLYLDPTVSVPVPAVSRGQAAVVEATFGADAGGQRIDIAPPAGTTITAVDDPAFSVSSSGLTGTLPVGSTSLRFTLTADEDARLGAARGGRITWGDRRVQIAELQAWVGEAPAVNVPDVAVMQGATVDVPLAFNETATGATEIVVPAGFASGTATGGFTWDAALPGFRGTVTGTNRDVALTLTAKADAPVGAAEGRVTQAGSGLNQVWSATFESAAPAPVAPLVVESPKSGDTIRETTPVFRGTAQPGSRIVIRGLWGGVLGSVEEVAANGAWSITWNKDLLPGRYVGGTVEQSVVGAPTQTFVYDFTIAASSVTPLLVTSPTIGETVTETSPVFTGTGQPGARIEIRGASGAVLGEVVEVDSSGAWTITWNKSLLPNRYVGGTVKQFVDGAVTHTFVYDFTIVQPRLVVTSPRVGDTLTGTRPVFTGTANPGARVRITGAWGTDLGSAIADPRTGEWTITWPRDYLPARYFGGTVTETVGGKVIASSGYDFTLTQ
ncbi:hypothetical protein [Plantibacter sp. CFBP 8804]|uniref:hypothetical protein n=1 Tax=Plantibacter sp. CFBP 8804 TaxID=2775270 RepID=UPI001786448F|nr:hypothetical protein [Plantibacter sp. CFBP 8804]MBD8518985.1 hypothetical protein [Plantibacter sp. CFBP 8804]